MKSILVLIIDDESDICEIAQASLEIMRNWRVITANTGAAGLAQAIAAQPNAILLDMILPDMTGQAVLQALKNAPVTQDIPVIFLTAKTRPIELQHFAALPVAAVFTKPFNPELLADQIAAALGWDEGVAERA
jgi:CheY-like chemotaxis protein